MIWNKPIVINLYGPPGSGKSTGAAFIFCQLKMRGVNCELITEFAKDKTWEHNSKALSVQEYVFGKQSYRMQRCRDDIDVIITDSPLMLSPIYNSNPALDEHFEKVVYNIYDTYSNLNYFIRRVKPYNPKGRNQTEEEADALMLPIKNILERNYILYDEVDGDEAGYMKIVNETIDELSVRGILI